MTPGMTLIGGTTTKTAAAIETTMIVIETTMIEIGMTTMIDIETGIGATTPAMKTITAGVGIEIGTGGGGMTLTWATSTQKTRIANLRVRVRNLLWTLPNLNPRLST